MTGLVSATYRPSVPLPSCESFESMGHNRGLGGKRLETRLKRQPSRAVETNGPNSPAVLIKIVERMACGDQSALSELYDATSRFVYGLCMRILSDAADAEEVTLDVYSQAWRQASRYDQTRGVPTTWLLTLAHSRSIDRLRSRGGRTAREEGLDAVAELPALSADPESSSSLSQRASFVRRALSRLSPEQREVLELAYFEGLTHVEIADRIRLPLGTAKSRIRLGLARLRQSLAPIQEGWPA